MSSRLEAVTPFLTYTKGTGTKGEFLMRRGPFLLTIMIVLGALGLAMSGTPAPTAQAQGNQTGTPEATATLEPAFRLVSSIGKVVPRKALYNPQYERLLLLDAYNRLVMTDALTYAEIAVLHENTPIVDIQFSHDGTLLSVLTDRAVELWDVQTNTVLARLTELNSPFALYGPLTFSRDDSLLMFSGLYPTPRNLRREETDRSIYPWVWDIAAARGLREASLPNRAEAAQLFDYIAGAALAPGNLLIGALPGRVMVMDGTSLRQLYDIPIQRYARDPFNFYNSQLDGRVYLGDGANSAMVVIDPASQSAIDLPLGMNLTAEQRASLDAVGALGMKQVGPARSNLWNPIHARLLGQGYRNSGSFYVSTTLTLYLLDLVLPPSGGDVSNALIAIEDHSRGTFTLRLVYADAQQMLISPDGESLLVREYNEDIVTRYELDSGNITLNFTPALRLNRYSRTSKNRVLAYDTSGDVIVTDFQRISADGAQIITQDLAYSRSYDRFYFAPDNRTVITMAGSEWRQWDVTTTEVLRREVITSNGSLVATAASGTRLLYEVRQNQRTGMEVVDLTGGGVVRQTIAFDNITGHGIDRVIPNRDWTAFLVVYSVNGYGPYAPGNQIAMYKMGEGKKWLIAGDDLPTASGRNYVWVDNETIGIIGSSERGDIPPRVYGVQYAPSGLPACLVERFPDADIVLAELWDFLVWKHRHDYLDRLTETICAAPPTSLAEAAATLQPTATPFVITATPIASGDLPACFAAVFGQTEADLYLDRWRTLTDGLTAAQTEELAVRLCEGIRSGGGYGSIRPPQFVMLIDAETGVRAAGAYEPPLVVVSPLDPLYQRFRRTYDRDMGTAVLSDDRRYIAASSMPGELVVYELILPYERLVVQVTETAQAAYNAANQIVGMPTATPTYNLIGTARPTLTPTITPTFLPDPQEPAYAELMRREYRPSALWAANNPPPGWDAAGRILAPLQGDIIWAIEPEDGTRYEAPEAPRCNTGLTCTFSPDREWVLVDSYDITSIMRPDGSAERILYDQRTPMPDNRRPNSLRWANGDTLEWNRREEYIDQNGVTRFGEVLRRDVLNVFPDPNPVPLEGHTINGRRIEELDVQPAGEWAVAITSYNTGLGTGYRYYLYNLRSGEYRLFARNHNSSINTFWHPQGDRLFWTRGISTSRTDYFQMAAPDWTPQALGSNMPLSGTWSPDGSQVASTASNNAGQYLIIWNVAEGIYNTYHIPETDRSSSLSNLMWSPDSRYLAFQTSLPRDRGQNVGAHTLVVQLSTGEVVDLTTGALPMVAWVREPGTYDEERRVTPTPTATYTPSPTPTP